MKTAAPLDVDSDEVLAESLTAAAADETPGAFMTALREAATAYGMTQVAQASGVGRESLYKALGPGGNPSFRMIWTVLRALNVDIRITVRAPPAGPVLARRAAKKRKEDATKKIYRRRKTGKLVVAEPPDF